MFLLILKLSHSEFPQSKWYLLSRSLFHPALLWHSLNLGDKIMEGVGFLDLRGGMITLYWCLDICPQAWESYVLENYRTLKWFPGNSSLPLHWCSPHLVRTKYQESVSRDCIWWKQEMMSLDTICCMFENCGYWRVHLILLSRLVLLFEVKCTCSSTQCQNRNAPTSAK